MSENQDLNFDIVAAMGKVIAIANQKGGVGKTTTAINLGASLAAADARVLILDMDAQANCTSGLGVDKSTIERSMYHGLLLDEPLEGMVRPTELSGLDLIVGDRNLVGAEVELIEVENREFVLKEKLGRSGLQERYDYILIDCPPSLGLLTLNSLVAADAVLVPIQCEYFALEGLSELMGTIDRIREQFNPHLVIQGVVLTMVDERLNLSQQVRENLREHLKDKLLTTYIPRNVRLAEAPSFGKPILLYDIKSRGAGSYIQLAREILNHEKESTR